MEKNSVQAIPDSWWSTPIDDLLGILVASQVGLTQEEAAIRLKTLGPNVFARQKKFTVVSRFLHKLANPLILLLLVSGFISALLGQVSDFIIIAVITCVSIALDVFQEHKAEDGAEKLRKRVQLMATVLRDGVEKDIPMTSIVPGDIVHIKVGDIVPGDGRIISEKDLMIDESSLTGESYPAEKHAAADPGSDIDSRRTHAIYMGTTVLTGDGIAVIVMTGGNTQIGKIAGSLVAARPKTEFEKGIGNFGNLLMRTAIITGAIVFVFHISFQRDIFTSLLFVLALAIAFAPELLPMVITINLSKGALLMSHKGVIVKSLPSIENFGSMDILATDKTGTITENVITLEQHIDSHGHHDKKVLSYGYMASLFQTGFKGPMEQAVLIHREAMLPDFERVDTIPFDFYRKRVSVIVRKGKELLLIVKGAPEEIIDRSTAVEREGELYRMADKTRQDIRALFEKLSKDGLRLLAVAYKKIPSAQKLYKPTDEQGLTFLGFLAYADPAKSTAAPALTRLEHLGLSIKIITGDNELVTENVCRSIGLPIAGIVSADDIESLSEAELESIVDKTTIFARVNPNTKERIIKALRARGHVVGYMGDGINDATSLRAADIGISVNNAVDVAKESADIILLHKDLHVLADGVHEGRKTFGNVMKYLMMGISSNFGNTLSLVVGSIFLPFLPMLPVQILLNDLLYDVSQLLVASDNVDESYLKRPRKWDMRFLRRFMTVFGTVNSLFDLATFYLLLLFFHATVPLFQTGWFVENIVAQTLIVFSIRTTFVPFFKSRPSILFSISVLVISLFALALPFLPMAALFSFVRLPMLFYPILAVLIIAYFFMVEGVKRWFYGKFQEA